MSKEVGLNIVKYRKLNGMSQKYLASKIGISVQGLLKIEKGMTSPRAATLELIMEALSLTPNQIFGVEPITEENSGLIERLKRMQ